MLLRIPASERTSQKLDELRTQGMADGDARTELLKLPVRKIAEDALEGEVAEAVGRDNLTEFSLTFALTVEAAGIRMRYI